VGFPITDQLALIPSFAHSHGNKQQMKKCAEKNNVHINNKSSFMDFTSQHSAASIMLNESVSAKLEVLSTGHGCFLGLEISYR
jgi:hypothetical protein